MFDPVEKLKEFIRHPSISADSQARAGMKGAQEFVSGLLTSLGFTSEVVKTDLHPIIFAQRGGDASWPHVLIYGHYDVQAGGSVESLDDDALRADDSRQSHFRAAGRPTTKARS